MIGLAGGASIKTDQPFVGVRHYHSLHTSPRPLTVHIVEFDLTAPGIAFRVRPPGPAPHENSLKTVKNFLIEQRQTRPDARIAINGSFFGSDTNGVVSNSGLVASDGVAYSSFDSWDGMPWPAVHLSQTNIPTLVQRPSPSYFGFETSPPTTLYNCISGSEIILSNGVNVAHHPGYPGDPFSMHPRTAIGFSANKLFFVTVDGRQTGVSEGVTTSELADILLRFGIKNAVNLDGGGSTTLVFADPAVRVVNVPMSSWNSTIAERAVAASWAAFAQEQSQDQGSWCLFADFENGDESTFSQSPTASGSTYGILSGSSANAISSDGYKSSGCQKLNIFDNPAMSGGWFVRHLSGSQARRSQNRICPTKGYVGFYAKTDASGISAAIAIDNTSDVTADRGVLKPLIGDGRWHLYEWNLEAANQWEGWANGDGIIDTPDFTVDSIQFYGPDSDCEIYVDTIAHNSTGSIGDITSPGTGVASTAFISEPFDTYPDGGTGWNESWGMASGTVNSVALGSDLPINGGGSYLTYRTIAAGTNGVYRDFAGDIGSAAYTLAFDVRIDALGAFYQGADLSDRIQVYGETGTGTSDAGANASFLVMASPNFKTPAGQPSGNWQVYNGIKTGAWSSNYMVNSGIPVVDGGVYSFTITVHPATLSYDVTIENGTSVFTRAGLGFRTGSTAPSDRLVFSNKIRLTGPAGNQLKVSYDSIRIYEGIAHDPVPSDGQEEVPVAGVVLSWKNALVPDPADAARLIPDPALTGHYVYRSPANETGPVFVTADANGDGDVDEGSSYVMPLELENGVVYTWRVDESRSASGPDDAAHLVRGATWTFATESTNPIVEAGRSVVTWLEGGAAAVQPEGAIVWCNAPKAVLWTVVSQPEETVVQFSSTAIEAPAVTLNMAGEYVLRLRAEDVKGKTHDDTMTIQVYADSCRAARSVSVYQPLSGDLNADCKVDMDDLLLFAPDWLEQNFLLDSYRYDEPNETGYDLWLRYPDIRNRSLAEDYKQIAQVIVMQGDSETLMIAREELKRGLDSMLKQDTAFASTLYRNGAVILGTPETSAIISSLGWGSELSQNGPEGYVIRSTILDGRKATVIASLGQTGVLYGVFHFLRLIQTQAPVDALSITETPLVKLRLLNHWDSLKGTAKSTYSGPPIWKWDELPGTLSPRYIDYARANASIGINGTVVNSLGADPKILTAEYIVKVKALAEVLRPYGIRVYLSANFAAPMSLGGLQTADPLDPQVRLWWRQKADEIYQSIPDFGGFLVKADSEGMPGPAQYGRNHAEGANMLAEAVSPHGGIVMWRAFVYGSEHQDPDRIKQAYEQFVPLDGQFNDNVLLQVKNGPLDFQPREPVMPLYGAMPNTSLMMEFEIRQEYLGACVHLVYLAPMWEEVLKFDTRANGQAAPVGRIVDGSVSGRGLTGIAGVANTGSDANWCGHHFAQSDWYCFGRQAWNHTLDSRSIAEEWTRMTFANEPSAVNTIVGMMMGSHEACVNYMTPLGLHVLCSSDHYNPAPKGRMSYHKADTVGLGYNRTATGSGGVGQYQEPYRSRWNDLSETPEIYLCWFHHVPWDHPMQSGRTFWEELCYRYKAGAAYVDGMLSTWKTLEGAVDPGRYGEVLHKLEAQKLHSERWRDTCLQYFQQYSLRPIP